MRKLGDPASWLIAAITLMALSAWHHDPHYAAMAVPVMAVVAAWSDIRSRLTASQVQS